MDRGELNFDFSYPHISLFPQLLLNLVAIYLIVHWLKPRGITDFPLTALKISQSHCDAYCAFYDRITFPLVAATERPAGPQMHNEAQAKTRFRKPCLKGA